MRKLLSVLLTCCAWTACAAYGADAGKPAYLQEEVLRSAMAIGLTDEQKPQFGSAISDFANGRTKAINKLLRRGGTDIPRKIRSKTKGLLKKMDKQMQSFLTDEQWPKYEQYRAVLISNLRGG